MRYNTLVIDPPWPMKMLGKFGRRFNRSQELPYKTMCLKNIPRFNIERWANKGAHVYMWTVNKHIEEAYKVFRSWEVRPYLMLVAVKPSGVAPQGYVFGTEFCLLGFYGKPMQKFKDIGTLNWFKMFNKSGAHSTKPDEFYNLVERMSPEPYIDLFARKKRKGWKVWGDEV